MILRSFIIFLLSASFIGANGQDLPADSVRAMVQKSDFEFVPQTAYPLRGNTRQLNAGFSLKVSAKQLNSYLPYFGQATGPVDPRGGGIEVDTKEFKYKILEDEEDRWQIMITPVNVSGIRELQLTVFNNGRATLHVSLDNRDPISFRGYIRKREL